LVVLPPQVFICPSVRVRGWSWETFWISGGVFSWLIAPIVAALILVPKTFSILAAAPGDALFSAWLLGALWGVGGLTFGLSMRYLGIALGYAVRWVFARPSARLCRRFGR
jgi:L-rhamnose-H+ transport protein